MKDAAVISRALRTVSLAAFGSIIRLASQDRSSDSCHTLPATSKATSNFTGSCSDFGTRQQPLMICGAIALRQHHSTQQLAALNHSAVLYGN